MELNKIIHGNNLDVISNFPDNSVDAIITDSPYGLGKEPDAVKCLQDWIDHGYHEVKGRGFMGKDWDAFVPQPILWKECFRVLKPGGHLLSFFGTRTYDWGTLAIRLAGFEIRDCIMWVYASGFPKSLDVSKAIDKAAGAERKVIGQGKAVKRMIPGADQDKTGSWIKDNGRVYVPQQTAPSTDDAKKWEGFGTALKPAIEPICVARKPLEGTVVENVLKYGTGAINIADGRIEYENVKDFESARFGRGTHILGGNYVGGKHTADNDRKNIEGHPAGRWPANIIHDGSEDVLECFPDAPGQQAKITGDEPTPNGFSGAVSYSGMRQRVASSEPRKDKGSAARFFYCAKPSPSERAERKHITIKPIALMEHLVKLYCPPGGICLDPHIGSGTTAVACIRNNRPWIGIEIDPESVKEAEEFIEKHKVVEIAETPDPQMKMF